LGKRASSRAWSPFCSALVAAVAAALATAADWAALPARDGDEKPTAAITVEATSVMPTPAARGNRSLGGTLQLIP
jgi:hypothetical protein